MGGAPWQILNYSLDYQGVLRRYLSLYFSIARRKTRLQKPSAVHDTFVIERHFPKNREAVFTALSEPSKRRRWFAEGDQHDTVKFESDFRVGGSEILHYKFKSSAPGPVVGKSLTVEARFEDIVPNQRIVTTSVMSLEEARISASLVTLELLANGTGTDLICTHQGTFFEGAGDPKMREDGWRRLLDKLAGELSD